MPISPFACEISKSHNEVAMVTLKFLSSASGRGQTDTTQAGGSHQVFSSTKAVDVQQISSGAPEDQSDPQGFYSYWVLNWNSHVREAEEHFERHRDTLLDFCGEDTKAFRTGYKHDVASISGLNFRLKSTQIEPRPFHVAVYFNLYRFTNEIILGLSDLEVKDGTGASPLHIAAEQGFEKLAQRLLQAGFDQASRDLNGKNPLHRAAAKGHLQTVTLLLTSDIDCLDSMGRSALFIACRYGQESTSRKLLESGADPDFQTITGETPLSTAVSNGHLGVVRLLLATKKGWAILADRQGLCHLVAARKGYVEVLELLLNAQTYVDARDSMGQTLLLTAVVGGHESVVELPLEAGADVNANSHRNWTAVHYAAKDRHEAVVELLLKAGADANTKNQSYLSALHTTALNGSQPVLQLLLKGGADVYEVDENHQTALYIAVSNNHESLIQPLLEAGSAVNSLDSSNSAPLHIAYKKALLDIVKKFLEADADNSIRNKDEITPVNLAAKHSYTAILALFS